MSILNHVWEFIVKFENDRVVKPIPLRVKEEFVSFFLFERQGVHRFQTPRQSCCHVL